MTWDWKREFKRQHGTSPNKGRARQNHGHDDQAAEEAEGVEAKGHHAEEPREVVEVPARLTARKAEPKRAGETKARESILSLLGAGDIAHLDSMAKEAGKDRAQLAADLLADLLADDAEAHEGGS